MPKVWLFYGTVSEVSSTQTRQAECWVLTILWALVIFCRHDKIQVISSLTTQINGGTMAAEGKTDKEQEPKPGSKQLLNDIFRKSLGMTGAGRVVMTSGVDGLPAEIRTKVLLAVRDYDNFEDSNDPYGEHDFGVIKLAGQKVYWKMDYYDANFEYGGDVNRLLTIMLAEEY